MEKKIIKLGFNQWLLSLDIAPYPVVFWDTPKFLQLCYIQKWLREIYRINVVSSREDDYWICNITEFNHGNKSSNLCAYFNSYEEAVESGLIHEIDKLS